MLAIDTNVVVRVIVGDNAEQSSVARKTIETETVFVGLTVFLEAAWVLRSSYGYTSSDVVRFLRAFSGLPSVMVEDSVALNDAFEWMESGMGIADAFHLVASRECAEFATFDRALARRGASLASMPIRLL